jgi:UDP-N-acetylglucosamine 2-epimerase (non-hydrolysing)
LHFAPTNLSRRNLLNEGVLSESIFVTGNTVIDALLWVRDRIHAKPDFASQTIASLGINGDFVRRFLSGSGKSSDQNHKDKLVLVTGHRRESFGQGFENICQAIRQLVERHPDVGVLYPVHLNPNVQAPVRRILGDHPRIQLVEPLSYEPFVWLMEQSHFVLSDSGGVQEEAPSLGKPVLVMRDTTERPEGVEAGTCRLVGTNPETILREARLLLENPEEYRCRSRLRNPYGDGTASAQIIRHCEHFLAAGGVKPTA